MEWLSALRGKTVGLDTAPLIYFIEENPAYIGTVRPFFEALNNGEFRVVTSMVTLIEVLVHPFRRGDTELAARYTGILLDAAGLRVVPLSHQVAEQTARLRAEHDLRTPDAIQLATAISEGASSFLTNDSRLPSPPGLQMLVLDKFRG